MDSIELLKKIQVLQIRTNRMVNEVMAGRYSSAFRGQGIDFDEVRQYVPGDDIRAIDWNVTARTGFPHIKRFVEERELTVILLVDVSGSKQFGSVQNFKSDRAAEIAALLAFSAMKSNDKVGLILFSDQIESHVPPRKGKKHVLRIIHQVLASAGQSRGTDIKGALEHTVRVTRRRAVIFLISDFLSDDFSRALRLARRRHDIVAVPVHDPREERLQKSGLIRVRDPETGKTLVLDTSSHRLREAFSLRAERRRDTLQDIFLSSKIDHLPIWTDRPYIDSLRYFFKKRGKRFR